MTLMSSRVQMRGDNPPWLQKTRFSIKAAMGMQLKLSTKARQTFTLARRYG
jgi:hypothetical protein